MPSCFRRSATLAVPRHRYENSHNDFEIRWMWRELWQIRAPNSVPSPGSDIWETHFDVNPLGGSRAS
jgi:hypothetical protein